MVEWWFNMVLEQEILCSYPCNVIFSPIYIDFHLLDFLQIFKPQVRSIKVQI